jgi:hypothetical protein
MHMKRQITALVTSLLVASVWAQTATTPLNLKLPPSDVPASSSTAAKPASKAPGVYYGDTSGSTGNSDYASRPTCDDSTFNQPQVHGSVSTGVVSGSHMGTGTWNAGNVNVSKNFGSCDEHTGSVNLSIGVSDGNFHGRGH